MYEMTNIKKLPKLGSKASEAWQTFLAFDKAALADGAISQEVQGAHGHCRGIDHAVPLLHRDSCRCGPQGWSE